MAKTMASMREKKRYIVFKIHSKEIVSYPNVKAAIWNSLTEWLGANQLAKAGVRIIKNLWNEKEQIGFIRTSHKFVDSVKVSLGLIHQIGDQRVIFQTLRVSGTIKSAKEKIKSS